MPKHFNRPQSLEEIFADGSATNPNHYPALAAWEEEQAVQNGIPQGDLKTRVAYLQQQTQLDPTGQTRLIRRQVAQDAAAMGQTFAPTARGEQWRQGDPRLEQLTQNVRQLSTDANYAGQDSTTMMRHLGSGWNPNPLPAAPVPPMAPLQSARDGLLNAYHTTRANIHDTSAAIQQIPVMGGYAQSAANQHAMAEQQRQLANQYAAPPQNARLIDHAMWQAGNNATTGAALAAGGLPIAGARVAATGVAGGLANLGRQTIAATPSMVNATGQTYNALLDQGFHPEDAAAIALSTGGVTGAAGQLAPQLAPGQGLGERVFTGAVNQRVQEAVERLAEQRLLDKFTKGNY